MDGLMILVILLFVGGIILLSGKSAYDKKTREQFLHELAEFLESTLEPIEDGAYKNSYRIHFKFSGKEFVYEDIEKYGFKGKVNVAHLKIKTSSKFTLTFKEKKRSTRIRTDVYMASADSSQQTVSGTKPESPKYLKDMDIFTNDAYLANKLFKGVRTASLFRQFKNIDTRGCPFMSIRIVDGNITLEFYMEKTINPNISNLRSNVASMENYLNKLVVLIGKIKE